MSAPKKALSFRGDLEGMRGIALVIILFLHLVGWPAGGFVALDVFFVLSGYLITGLLLREYRLTGTISLTGFYRRRIRRLMPSALLVLLVTCLAALFVFIGSRAVATLWDALWSVLLASNWNFALNGTDYFATSLPQSPLLHFWSLSVEEQFYLFWPAIVLGLLLIGTGRRRAAGSQSLRPLVVGIAVIGLLSFAWGAVQADLDPQVSYLSTLTRIWELAAGALVCFAAPALQKLPQAARPVLAWTGFAAILVCAFVYTPALHYPGVWCLLPVASTLLIIVAGIGGPSRLVIATNPLTRFLGRISYTGYLWHWPVFLFAGVLFGKDSPVYLFAALPLALVLAALTTRFVEDPIRHSGWLEPRRRSRRRNPRERAQRVRIGFVSAGVVVAVGLVAVIALAPRAQVASLPVASVVDPAIVDPSVVDPGAAGSTTPASDAPATPVDAEQKRLSDAITVGLTTADWPDDLDPGLDALGMAAYAPQWTKDGCLDISDENIDSCVYGDASLPKTAVLLGDSTAISYLPGLAPALNSLGYRIQVLTHAQCSFANVQVLGQSVEGQAAPGFPEVCDTARQYSIDEALRLQPDLVVVTDAETEVTAMVVTGDAQRFAAMQAGMADSLSKLAPIGAPIVVLSGPPQTVVLSSCATRLNHPSDCIEPVSNTWLKLLNVQRQAAEAVTPSSSQPIRVVDTSLWYCSAKGACPSFAGTTPIRADALHLTALYAANLQSILKLTFEGLLPAG